jgi:hypothetical protein
MASSVSIFRIGILPVLFWAVSCMNDSIGESKPPDVESKGSGQFRIILTEKTVISQGLPTVQGKVYDGPMPSSILWQEAVKSGACALYKPKAPFCDPGCGSNALCVSDGVCKAFPKSIGVGKVTVTGAKTLAGATTFAMDPILNGYQPPAGTNLEYVPFAEGDPVSVSAAGDTGLGAFSVNGKAIARLVLLNDSIVLEDGKPIQLRWTPPGKDVGSTVAVMVDISHHGGSKGKIECEAADNGSLDISASLVDALKALGISGWPAIEVTRRTVGTNTRVGVNLEIESPISRTLGIPGLISCTGDEECPGGKTCQPDLQCK